mgnify:CR=1 FL=1
MSQQAGLWVGVVTLFPQMFDAITKFGVTSRAVKQGLLQVECWNPRDYTHDKHNTVDDRPFGGGPGMLMMDLGSAPGGWSQIAGRMVGATGRVIASDILPMDSLDNVDFIQGDFTDDKVFQQILDLLDGRRPDLIVSDIAPNISGVGVADQAASMYLVELVLDMARQVLKPGGNFVAKVFQGEGSDEYLRDVRRSFEKVMVRKPAASRPRSREVYYVAKGFKGDAQ